MVLSKKAVRELRARELNEAAAGLEDYVVRWFGPQHVGPIARGVVRAAVNYLNKRAEKIRASDE